MSIPDDPETAEIERQAMLARIADAESKLAEAEVCVDYQAHAIQEISELLEVLRAERPTLRDELAMRAPLRLLLEIGNGLERACSDHLTAAAYDWADRMLEARKVQAALIEGTDNG